MSVLLCNALGILSDGNPTRSRKMDDPLESTEMGTEPQLDPKSQERPNAAQEWAHSGGLSESETDAAPLRKDSSVIDVPTRRVHLHEDVIDSDNPQIKEDMLRMIIQYLQDEGYSTSVMTIQDEANIKVQEQISKQAQLSRMKTSILEGDWAEVEKLSTKSAFKNQRGFLYAVYKQQYFELIERQEYQKAFTILTKRLKPLESMKANPNEFKDLCFLLTCKSVQDCPSFKSWDGNVVASRENLVEQYQALIDSETAIWEGKQSKPVPPARLLNLIKQASLYQIEFSRHRPRVPPKLTTLLEDYSCYVVPNSTKSILEGHRSNVKCVSFVGDEGLYVASGSSDNTVRLWKTSTGAVTHILSDHKSRIWDVASNSKGSILCSASGDSTIKIWDTSRLDEPVFQPKCISTLSGHSGDVYSVDFRHDGMHVATGGYDKSVKFWDAHTGTLLRTFEGHESSVSRVIFSPLGNLVISGSKDSTIKFWDIISGVCIKTYSTHLWEVTSVAMNASGIHLLSGCKDNSNRLWDVRTGRPMRRFKGHQNTSKNFVRCNFGPKDELVVGGSEDGNVYIWDCNTGDQVGKLAGHKGVVYNAVWNANQALLASCSHDKNIALWQYDESLDNPERSE